MSLLALMPHAELQIPVDNNKERALRRQALRSVLQTRSRSVSLRGP